MKFGWKNRQFEIGRRAGVTLAVGWGACLACPTTLFAADDAGSAAASGGLNEYLPWGIAFAGAVAALAQAFVFFKKMMAADEGNERMVEIAGYVREGANAYLKQQYKVVGIFFVVIVALLAYAAFGLEVQSHWVPFAFLTGGFFSGLAGWFGMKTATWASSRTSAGRKFRSTRACKSPFAAAP